MRNGGLVFGEGIYIDYTGDRSVTTFCNGNLLNQPICRHFAICIGIRKPAVLARSSVASQSYLGRESSGTSDAPCVRLNIDSLVPNQVFGDPPRIVS
jgi:hypothetical protein